MLSKTNLISYLLLILLSYLLKKFFQHRSLAANKKEWSLNFGVNELFIIEECFSYELRFSNQSWSQISVFDVMIKKNSFSVIHDALCSKYGITYPSTFETSSVQVLPLKNDKANVDTKIPQRLFSNCK